MTTSNSDQIAESIESGIQVFRFNEVQPIYATGNEPFWIKPTPVMNEGFRKLVDAGWLEGLEFRVLLDLPGFNMVYGRVKPGLMIPLHFHEGHGIYFVTAGTALYGNVELKAGDGLFQPAKAPYTLTAGPQGAEIIEIRTVGGADTNFLSNSPKYWEKVFEKNMEAKKGWVSEWPEGYGVLVDNLTKSAT